MAEFTVSFYDRSRFSTRLCGRGLLPLPPPFPENDPMAVLGRLGQFLGLSIPAVAILLELNHAITLGQMLVMLVAALCCFWIGRIVEAYSRS